MLDRCRVIRYCGPLLLFAALFSTASAAQGTLAGNRDLMRRIAEGVADVIKKNFYDPSLKGVDLQKLLNETKAENRCQ